VDSARHPVRRHIAFLAVWLQNRSAARRHRAELEHDKQQRNLERLAEMRKLVYLQALEDLGAFGSVLTDLWNVDVPASDLRLRMEKYKSSMARLSGIASIETIKALNNADSKAVELMPWTFSVRLAADSCKSTSDRIRNVFEDSIRQRADITKRLKEDSALNVQQRKELEEERDRLLNVVEKTGKMTLDALSSDATFQLEFAVTGQKRIKEYNRAMSRVVVEIRKELGFEIDESAFLAFTDAAAEEQHKAFLLTMEKIKDTSSKHLEAKLGSATDGQKGDEGIKF
jgi:hypothetical protein